ncbi:uncharacterized protein LOC118180659 [Stegodyphus dumicola]|uniref:uncharacterized protein LOC118180659 n=1 Tax=Stegodyphus dumicola TaxID=202533 RepID=UPI0015AD24DA|nr:uncharacterized protein LOC118180659 [Stegodyphus dumicola]
MALGPFCKALGIDEEVLSGQKTKTCDVKSITNGVMWELKKYKTAKKLSLKDIVDWLIKIFQIQCENSEAVQGELNEKYESLLNIRNTLLRSPNRYRGEMERLMNWPFDLPAVMGVEAPPVFEPTVQANLGPKLLKVLKEKGGDDDDAAAEISDDDDEQVKKRKAREEIVQLKKDLGSAKKVITSLNDKMSDLSKRCLILNDLSKSCVSERRRIENDIAKLKAGWNNVMSNWHDCMERLNHVNNNKGNYLDVGYMVRRNKTKQGIFDELNFEFEKTLEEFKYKVSSLIEKERRKKKVASREYRQKSKSDRKRVRQESEDTEENKKICLSEEANKQISTSMSIEEFMKSEKVDEFKGGKFINALKAVYTELTSMPVPCNNVHEIIFSILDELEPLNTEKIPSQSFAGNILMEARMIASLEAFSDLLKMSKVSICNDGASKFSWSDTCYVVTLPDETHLKLGIRDISQGSPDTSLNSLKDIIGDIVNAKVEVNEALEPLIKILSSLIDQHFLEKKIIEILFLYKQQVLPLVINNLETFPDAVKSKVFLLNNFCTGLYFLLGLAKLADVTVLTWESLSLGGSSADVPKDNENNQILSKTVQQMYAFCSKVDADSSDEIGSEFRAFVQNEKKLDCIPVAPYKSIFNTIFHNSAGIWFYHEIGLLSEFFEKIKEKEIEANSLAELLNEKHSYAFARALGLLGKLVAVPLWTVLEDDDVEIGSRYRTLLNNVENWAKDSSKFMKGQERLFEDVPVSHDAVYVSLIKDNESSDASTKEILELMFTAFVPYIKYFLFGNAAYEKLNDSAMETDDIKLSVHEDFGLFDRITMNIHSATKYALDALMLYSKTRNGAWQDKLGSKDNIKVFELIEKDYAKQLKTLYKRKIKLSEIKGQAEGKNLDEYSKCQLIEKKYKLIDDLMKWGGLWKSEKEIDAQIKEMKESDRLSAFRAQIRFRRHILGEEHNNGLLDLASEGECFNAAKLHENLKTILKKECEMTETDVFELASATDDESSKEKIYELCKNAQELKPYAEPVKSTLPKENFHWLLGKLISHKWISDQGEEIVTGICIAKKKLGGVYSYFISYKEKGVYSIPESRIAEDFRKLNLKVIEPSVNDLVGSRLSRAFIKDDGDLEWHDCKVIGVTSHGSEFVVEFDFYGGCEEVNTDVQIPELETFTFTTNLLEDYRTDHLRLL